MDLLSKQILHQQILKLVKERSDWFRGDETRDASLGFLILAVSAYLSIDPEEALRLVVDGGGDAGIDALNVESLSEDEFEVTFF